jgi:hypothetical protein
MKRLYLSIVLLSFCDIKAQHNVIMEALDAPTIFTITACNVSSNGWLATGLPAQTADIEASQVITVNVISGGPYAFSTDTVNGVTFSASGVFTSNGVQNVTLVATGTPVDYTVGNGTFTYTVTNTTSETSAGSCSFTRKVYVPDQNYTGTIRNDGNHRFLYKVILGPGSHEWLQTNLGANYNKVGDPDFNPEAAATGVNDYKAFGSLFQVGRNSDGHELLNWTSATTATGLSTTATPAPAPSTNVNTGFFYTSTDGTRNSGTNPDDDAETGNFYGRKVLNVALKKYVVGPGDPCPTGFGVADETKYGEANYNAGSTAWFNNPIKLVAPQMYRNAADGTLIAYATSRRLMRTSQLGIFPTMTALSPQFVIEGGALTYSGQTGHKDRRQSGTSSTATVFDPRGTLDGYPVRCMKPITTP